MDQDGTSLKDAQPTISTQRSRILFLEWIRGIAALLVVVQHVAEYAAPDALRAVGTLVNPGRVGVVAFFMVSGYVISLSLEKQDLRTFMTRRIHRLYPSYWVCLATAVVVLGIYGEFADVSPAFLGIAIVINVTMLQGLLLLPSLLDPAWTLSIEWLFYFQQMLFKARGSLLGAWRAGYAWSSLFVAVCIVERVTGVDLPATSPLLVAVSCLGHAWASWDLGRITVAQLSRLVLAIGIAIPLGIGVGIDTWQPATFTISAYAGIALFVAFWRGREHPGHRVLVWFGSISYALYLSHGLILYPVTRSLDLSPWLLVLISAVTMPALAWALHVLVEQPFIRRGRALTQREAGAQQGVA